jgi:hypothetical protein
MVVSADPFASQLANKSRCLLELERIHPAIGKGLSFEDRHFPILFRQEMSGSESGKAGSYHDAAFRIHFFTIP